MENDMNSVIDENTVMTQIELTATETKKTGRRSHFSSRIDMTPMVDLGFLLISFFIFTTSMSDKTTMKLYMPHDGDSSAIGKSKVLTVLLGDKNKVYAYEGAFEDALEENKIIATNYDESNGIGNLIREKQTLLLHASNKKGKDALVFLIKPAKQSTYKNVIDALDEATINGVTRYMVVDASAKEEAFIKK